MTAPATARRGVPLGRVLGVPVLLTPSWFLLAAGLVVLLTPPLVPRLGTGPAYATTVSFVLLLGASVLLHELGHCAVARAYGLPVRSITITFLAGFTEITRPPQTPVREGAVAAAGPGVSLLLCGAGLIAEPLLPPGTLTARLVLNVAITNGLIAAINLLPGLPLDGGRVVRALVWRLTGDPGRATRVAAWAGRAVGLVGLPLLLLVVLPALGYGAADATGVVFAVLLGGYVYSLATLALRQARQAEILPSVTARRLARPAVAVPADLPLAEAVRRAHAAGAGGLVVVDGGDQVAAVVSEAAVAATPQERRPWVTVGALSRRVEPGLVLDAGLAGEELLAALRATPAAEYVVRDGATGALGVLLAADVATALSAR